MTRVISIYNNKGGIGKTSSVVNVGVAMSKKGKKVLLIDTDSQGNLSTLFGDLNIKTSVDDLLENKEADVNDALIKNIRPNIDLLPNRGNTDGTETNISEFKSMRETILKRKLKPIRNNYDYILIDCPTSFGVKILNCFAASTEVIIPLATDIFSLDASNQVLDAISEIQDNLNDDLIFRGVLISKYDSRIKSDRELKEAVIERFGDYCYKTIIRNNSKIKDASANRTSVIEYDPKCYGSIDYINFANEIMEQE